MLSTERCHGEPLECYFRRNRAPVFTRSPPFQRRLSPLAATGRTALTNYLMPSLLCALLFYGYRLAGSVGPARGLLVAASLYGLQLVFSRWWLGRFRFGPAEWLGRSLTYKRLQLLRGPAQGATRCRDEQNVPPGRP